MTLRPDGHVVHPGEGLSLELGYTRLRLVLTAEETEGAFALTEQPLAATALAGPPHTHAREGGFADEPDVDAIVASANRHGTQLDLDSLPALLERHGLHLAGL
jgi:hypothetical protein